MVTKIASAIKELLATLLIVGLLFSPSFIGLFIMEDVRSERVK